MGTNYYVYNPIKIDKFDRRMELIFGLPMIHLGKSSAGWCFGLRVYDDIKNMKDWERFLTPNSIFFDEYGRTVTTNDMISTIRHRRGRPIDEKMFGGRFGYSSKEDFLSKNGAEIGPFDLYRHRIGTFCVGHGEGTWDLLYGEFS